MMLSVEQIKKLKEKEWKSDNSKDSEFIESERKADVTVVKTKSKTKKGGDK